MVKHHARKNEARGRRATTGESHRKAVEAVRQDQAEDAEVETFTATCTPNSHPHDDGRVEHGYQINVLDEALNILATVNLPDWESFRPASAGHRLIEHGYMIRPDARGPETVNGWRKASPNLDSWMVPVIRTDCAGCADDNSGDGWFDSPELDGITE